MATTNPVVSMSTTLAFSELVEYANDAAYVTGKGSAADNSDIYYNTTVHKVRVYQNGSWTNISEKTWPQEMSNYSISASVAASALTVALKEASGSDPSTSSPVNVAFRSSTATTGTYTQRSITAALSQTISSGSTLAMAANKTTYIYVYLVDNGGTVLLALSRQWLDEGTLQSTTAEGGAGGADSNAALYSSSAVSSKAIRLIGRLKVSLATPGTWDAAPTEVSLPPFKRQVVYSQAETNTATSFSSGATTIIPFEDTVLDTNQNINQSNATTSNWAWEMHNTAAVVLVDCAIKIDTGSAAWNLTTEYAKLWIYKNNSAYRKLDEFITQVDNLDIDFTLRGSIVLPMSSGDYLDLRLQQNTGASISLSGTASENWITVVELEGKQ